MSIHPLGNEIRAHRLRSRLTLKDVAKKTQCSAPYLCRIETGKSAPTDRNFLERLASALTLSGTQKERLIEAANESQKVLQLRGEMSLKAYQVAYRFSKYVTQLRNEDLVELDAILARAHEKGDPMPIS
jgi:transcriptional regulator with XRE-family HTH domain